MSLRVLSIEPAGNLWGSERALLDLIESVPGIEFAVCCPPRSALKAELWKRRIEVLPYFIAGLHRKPRWRRAQAAFGVLRACFAFKPDVIHVNQAGAWRVVLPAARLLDLPVVCHVRLFEDAAYLATRNPDPARLKSIVAISDAVKDEIGKFPNLALIPVHRIYDVYSPAKPDDGAAAAERMPSRMACIGRIEAGKGQELLLNALALMEPVAGGVECLIAGNGRAAYVAQLKKVRLARDDIRVEWPGFVADVVPLLRRCGILVCPSYLETLGRVILEVWDAGAVPVVYAGSGGAAEIVAAADGGILYDAQTPQSLAGALTAAIGLGSEERNRLIANGRAWMAQHCAPGLCGPAIADVFAAAA